MTAVREATWTGAAILIGQKVGLSESDVVPAPPGLRPDSEGQSFAMSLCDSGFNSVLNVAKRDQHMLMPEPNSNSCLVRLDSGMNAELSMR